MPTWDNELLEHSHEYVRRGGKSNRKKQISRIRDLLEFTAKNEKFHSIYRLGNRNIINFWKAHRDISESAAYEYWLAFCILWKWINKIEKPPKPNNFKRKSFYSLYQVTNESELESQITDILSNYPNLEESDSIKLQEDNVILSKEVFSVICFILKSYSENKNVAVMNDYLAKFSLKENVINEKSELLDDLI